MKSLFYTAALLPLGTLASRGGNHQYDEVVIVTSTRTVTVCPITDYWHCGPDDLTPTTWEDWVTSSSPTVAVTTTKSGGGDDGGHGGHGGHGGDGSWTSSFSAPTLPTYTTSADTTSSYSHPNGPDGTSSSPTYSTSSYSYSHPDGWSSTSNSAPTLPTYSSTSASTSSYPYSHSDGGSTTSYTHDTSSSTSASPYSSTTTTTSSSCGASATISALPETSCSDNTPSDRSKFCGKSVGDDTNDSYESGDTKHFTLTLTSDESDFDGTSRPAFLINGGTPGPLIEVNYGDWVEVVVTNLLPDNSTTIHWHGIRQIGTNDQDGVPGVTECAIPPLGQRTYKFLASTYGTGWYHSHALSQYGAGIRGPLIVHGPATANYDYDSGAIMIDEVFPQTIFQMAYNIARLRGPLPPAINYLLNGHNKAVDGSGGKSTEWVIAPGKKHRFHVINSSTQASYVLHLDNHKFTVISADFTPIVPYTTDFLYVNPGQRYSVIVEFDQTPGAYFLRAITQTGCGTSNTNNGLGSVANGIVTYKGSCGTPVTDPAVTTFGTTLASDCKDEALGSLVPYVSKNAGSQSDFTSTAKLLPGGNAAQQNFDGYGPISRWFFGPETDISSNSATALGTNTASVDFDNPTLKNIATLPTVPFTNSIYGGAIVLDGTPGDWVYFVIQNNFQTSHPIHLHGHDFSVLGQGKGVFTADQASSLNFANPIRRDTALLFGFAGPQGAAQSGYTVIGFQTDNPGAWIMHCHITWHAEGGMALQYIEQPDHFDASTYWESDSFQNECSAYDSYIAGGGGSHLPYESGLKHRDLHRHAHGSRDMH